MYFSKYNHKKGSKEHERKWIDALLTKPEPYSLNNLLLDTTEIKRGWWTGTHWDGLKMKHFDKVTHYKKCGE